MNKTIITLIIAFLFTGSAYAASNVIKTDKRFAEVNTPYQNTEVYKIYDPEAGVTCYYAFIKGNGNSVPQQSCVKTKE